LLQHHHDQTVPQPATAIGRHATLNDTRLYPLRFHAI
jgi:hypothetical protein